MPVIPHRHGKQLSLYFPLFLMCTKRYISIICFRSDIFFHFIFFNLWDSMNYIFFPVTFIYFICELSTGSLYLIFSAVCLAMNYCYINIFFYKLICILFILKQFHKFILAINLCDKVIGESKYCTLHINVIQHV